MLSLRKILNTSLDISKTKTKQQNIPLKRVTNQAVHFNSISDFIFSWGKKYFYNTSKDVISLFSLLYA